MSDHDDVETNIAAAFMAEYFAISVAEAKRSPRELAPGHALLRQWAGLEQEAEMLRKEIARLRAPEMREWPPSSQTMPRGEVAEPEAGLQLDRRKAQMREIALQGVLALPTEDILTIYDALREHLTQHVPAETKGDEQIRPRTEAARSAMKDAAEHAGITDRAPTVRERSRKRVHQSWVFRGLTHLFFKRAGYAATTPRAVPGARVT